MKEKEEKEEIIDTNEPLLYTSSKNLDFNAATPPGGSSDLNTVGEGLKQKINNLVEQIGKAIEKENTDLTYLDDFVRNGVWPCFIGFFVEANGLIKNNKLRWSDFRNRCIFTDYHDYTIVIDFIRKYGKVKVLNESQF